MFELLKEMLSYDFLLRALIVGFLVSICSSLLGASLVLKRYSMIGDGLSHVGFGSLAAASAFNLSPLGVSVPCVIAASFILLKLSSNSKIRGDALIALMSVSAMALGIMIVSLTKGLTLDICNYMFGSILAMTSSDVYLSAALAAVVILCFVLFYNKIFAVTFDETFARSIGINVKKYNTLLSVLTAVTITVGMRMMGALLISSLIVFPALSAMRVCKTFRNTAICSLFISVFCFFIGLFASYLYEIPTGASIAVMNLAAFLFFCLIEMI
jgi:zinc transport system permease protein